MSRPDSKVTLHLAASLDGFIARRDGGVDWMETADEFAGGAILDPAEIAAFLASIDCYVMGSRTYETALGFAHRGLGWPYGDKPVVVLTSRTLPRLRDTIEFAAGDLRQLLADRLRPRFRHIWVVGGAAVGGALLRLGLADELRYSILPVLIGAGLPGFDHLAQDVSLHLTETKAYRNGVVALCYAVNRAPPAAAGPDR